MVEEVVRGTGAGDTGDADDADNASDASDASDADNADNADNAGHAGDTGDTGHVPATTREPLQRKRKRCVVFYVFFKQDTLTCLASWTGVNE
jgi:hypothetical protein